MPLLLSNRPTARENVLLNHTLDITPLETPLFPFPEKSAITPTSYLTPYPLTFGRRVAEWQNEFFGLENEDLQYRSKSFMKPLRPDAPTLVAIFYPDGEDKNTQRRSTENYLARIERLAALNEQTIIYVPPSLAPAIRNMRADEYWYVVDDYETIWDIPNNRHQKHNFTHVQPKIFRNFQRRVGAGFEPEDVYNHPHRSAVYNAKAFVTYDAVMRNPFGSEKWMYLDAGLFHEFGPVGKDGHLWGDMLRHQLSSEKFERSISISRDTGIVMGEYMQSLAYGEKDINHPGWTDPKKSWMCQHFVAQAYVGSSLGMLNYSVRFMQTVDDMDANNFYTAREEFVVPHVAIRYPNTLFTIPWMQMRWGTLEHPIKGCYLTFEGEKSVPAIGDPIEGTICRGYKSRRGNVEGRGVYEWPWTKRVYVYGRRY
jgi:hypothetical protein